MAYSIRDHLKSHKSVVSLTFELPVGTRYKINDIYFKQSSNGANQHQTPGSSSARAGLIKDYYLFSLGSVPHADHSQLMVHWGSVGTCGVYKHKTKLTSSIF